MASQAPPQGARGQPQIPFQGQPGQRPTPEQIQAIKKQLEIDAKKNGMTVPQFLAKVKEQAIVNQAAQQQAAQQGGQPPAQQQQQSQPQPITPGPPKPEALAVANFLKSQDLKIRTCILNGQRKDMFKGKNLSLFGCMNSNKSP
jgi:translocation protein SEC62